MPFHLDVLVYEQLSVFVDGKLMDTCSTASPVALSTMSFDPALLESIVLVLLRDKRMHVILGDRETLMARTM